MVQFMEKGSLQSHLKNSTVSETQRIQFGAETASGLQYLSCRGYVHRDIASRNVLLNSELRAKIADFGMSRDTSNSNDYYRSRGGNVPVYVHIISQ